MKSTVTAIQAVQNGGLHKVDEFEFQNGVYLTGWKRGPSLEIWEKVKTEEPLMSSPLLPVEYAGQLASAAGHLYKTVDFEHDRNFFGPMQRAAMEPVRDVFRASEAIAIAGGRDTQRNPIILWCGDFLQPIEETMRFRGLSKGQQGTDWDSGVLTDADEILGQFEKIDSKRCPRLAMAIEMESEAASLDFSRHWQARLVVAVSGLEVFYVAPEENMVFWRDAVFDRIPAAVLEDTGITKSWFHSLAKHRNGAVHRQLRLGRQRQVPLDACVVASVERLLRETIRYALLNRDIVDYVFRSGDWSKVH